MTLPDTMRAVVFDGPKRVSIQDRPVPMVQNGQDIIVRVEATALCGSELHVYRGHQPSGTGFIMGHEFTGTVVEKGADVRGIKIGDRVVAPFTTSCGDCFYCHNGYSSRCTNGLLFGSEHLDGAQAEYVRVPHANGTVVTAPPGIDDRVLILMADIFPTGFFGVKNAFEMLKMPASEAVVVVIGCGPVGLCAIISALEYAPKHLFAIDGVDSRLELAKMLGAEPLNYLQDAERAKRRMGEVTEGRGADAVVEVVGFKSALRSAYDVLRPFGVISSIGVHNDEIPWDGNDAYDKNLRVQMGRCPVRSIFPEALELLTKKQHLFGFMFDKIMPLSEAVEGYELFEARKVQKIIFRP